LFVLKESLAPENRRKFELWRANPVVALHALRRFPMIVGLCTVIILMRLAHDSNPAVFTYYVLAKFHWSPAMVGYSLMTVAAPIVLTQIFAYFSSASGPVYFSGAAFLTASLCLVVAALVFMQLRARPAVAAAEPAE